MKQTAIDNSRAMDRPGRRGTRHQAFLASSTVCAALALVCGPSVFAHEVDQYSPPPGALVDLGDYWNQLLYKAVHDAVEETNAKLRRVRHLPISRARETYISYLQSHDRLARAVRRRLPSALWAIEGLEVKLRWDNLVHAKQGQTYGYYAPMYKSVYSNWETVPDLRQIGRMSFMRCSLVQIHGTRVGTDKIAHFISMGYVGYFTYRKQVQFGVDPDKAMRNSVGLAARGPLAESGILGGIPTGVFSNADMAADYLGMKYFLNLMQPVQLQGRIVPPMVGFVNGELALQPDVRPDGPYFAQFVSPHFDEVLNPSMYAWGMRGGLRRGIEKHAGAILDAYAGRDPRKRNRDYFDGLLVEYSTYHGENYGHSGKFENLITVGNTCFHQPKPAAAPAAQAVQFAASSRPANSQPVHVIYASGRTSSPWVRHR